MKKEDEGAFQTMEEKARAKAMAAAAMRKENKRLKESMASTSRVSDSHESHCAVTHHTVSHESHCAVTHHTVRF